MKKIWEKHYIIILQAAGFLILCAFTAGFTWSGVQAYDGRLKSLETFQTNSESKIAHIEQKVDDMIAFWNVPHRQTKQ